MLLHGIIADRRVSLFLFAADDALATSHRWRVLREANDSQFTSTDLRSAHFLSHVTAAKKFASDGLSDTEH